MMDILSHGCPQPTSLNIQIEKSKAVCSLKNDHKILNIMTPPESKAILPQMSFKDRCQQRENSYTVQKASYKWTMANSENRVPFLTHNQHYHGAQDRLQSWFHLYHKLWPLLPSHTRQSSLPLIPVSLHPYSLTPIRRHSLLHKFKSLAAAAAIGRIHYLPAQLFGRTGMELVGWLTREKVKSKDRKK